MSYSSDDVHNILKLAMQRSQEDKFSQQQLQEVVLNLVTTPRTFWAVYPIIGWGLGLFFHGWAAYQTPIKLADKKFYLGGENLRD